MRTRPFLAALALILGLGLTLALLAGLPTARAASNIIVNTTDDELNDDGDCSLREAIQSANRDTPVDGCVGGSRCKARIEQGGASCDLQKYYSSVCW